MQGRDNRWPIDCCEMPTPAPRTEAEIYRGIRDQLIGAHCANKDRNHPCCGAITITARHVTMNCKLCGDARQVITDSTSQTTG